MQNGHQTNADSTMESSLFTKNVQSPSSRIFEDLASEIHNYEPKTEQLASDDCRCANR